MKKVFTPTNSKPTNQKVVVPSEKTLDFLKQFAHSYYIEKSLPEPINNLCIN